MATIRDLIGDTLSSKAGSVSADALSGKTVGIYFSAHWCVLPVPRAPRESERASERVRE